MYTYCPCLCESLPPETRVSMLDLSVYVSRNVRIATTRMIGPITHSTVGNPAYTSCRTRITRLPREIRGPGLSGRPKVKPGIPLC